jgi:hypothetical protein
MRYAAVIRSVDHLASTGWVENYKQRTGCRGWQSAFEATPALIDTMRRILSGKPQMRILRPRQVTILRDVNGVPISHERTRDNERRDRRTEAFNECIASAAIVPANQSNIIPLLNVTGPMARIFNQTMDRGGRFYSEGASWQNMKAEARSMLIINGEPMVELDFDGMHIAMLYIEAGHPIPTNCYDIDGWPRDLVKVATLTLINAQNDHTARLSIAHSDGRKIDTDTNERIVSPDDKQLMQILAEPGSQRSIKVAATLIRAIKRRHSPIEDQMHSDAGARLMRRDSDIAEAVMANLMLRQGIVALPVHDSFLVPASKCNELEAAMIKAAYQITGALLTVSKAGVM